MKKGKIILLIISIFIVLTLAMFFSYAFYVSTVNQAIENTSHVNTTLPDTYSFNSSGEGNINISFNSSNMISQNYGVVASDNASINVSLISPSSDDVTICTYDLVWEWTSLDKYTNSTNELPITYDNIEYNNELSIKASSTTRNNPVNLPSINSNLNETNLSNLKWNDNKAVIVAGATIASNSSVNPTYTDWNLTTSIYNLPAVQDAIADKNFNGKIKVDNVHCNNNNKLPSAYTQVTYLENIYSLNTGNTDVISVPDNFNSFRIETKTANSTSRKYEPNIFNHPIVTTWNESFQLGYKDGSVSLNQLSISNSSLLDSTNYIVADITPTKMTLYVDDLSTSSVSDNTSVTTNIGILGSQISYFYGKVYFIKFYVDKQLERELIPAVNNSSIQGLYDLVSGNFYPKSSFRYE